MKAFVNCWKANNIQLFPVEYLLFYSFSVFYLLYLTTTAFDKYLQFNVYYVSTLPTVTIQKRVWYNYFLQRFRVHFQLLFHYFNIVAQYNYKNCDLMNKEHIIFYYCLKYINTTHYTNTLFYRTSFTSIHLASYNLYIYPILHIFRRLKHESFYISWPIA